MSTSYYAWFVRGVEHANMCKTSIESVRKADPEAHCLVLTDEEKPQWSGVDAILMKILPGMPIMLANLEAQVNALSFAWGHDAHRIMFLDTDILLLRPFDYFGVVNFTWRDHVALDEDENKVEGIAARMPYNYGVITATPSLSALECFIWMRERIRNMHASHQQWYGNQLAAVELAGPRPESGCVAHMREIPWGLRHNGKPVLIGKLPCESYNYTPQKANEDVQFKHALHFKGRKRHLMKLYAKQLGLNWHVPEPKQTDLAEIVPL